MGFADRALGIGHRPSEAGKQRCCSSEEKGPGAPAIKKKNIVWLLNSRNRTSWFRTFSTFVRVGFVCKECPDSCSLVETNRACCDLVYPETSWGVAMQQWHSDTNCRIMRRELCLIPINAPILWFSRAKHYHYHLGLWRIGRFTESDSCESQG